MEREDLKKVALHRNLWQWSNKSVCHIPLNKGISMVVGIGFPGNAVVRSFNYIEKMLRVYSTTKSKGDGDGEAPSGSATAC